MKTVVPPPAPVVRPHWRWGMVCLAMLNVRWFLPTEATADGATLWLAAFWCAAAAITSWMTIAADPIARRWTRTDSAVALLVGGHVLSGVLVLVNGGQRQFAGNLIGEWLGIAALWSIVRDLGRIPWFRAALWQSTLMSLALLGAYGCWQHWYEFPDTARRLGPKFDAIRVARASGGTDPAEQELSQQGVPLTEPEFTLFEKRLRDSREPFGFFALANTLGGFLAAGLMLLLADIAMRQTRSAGTDRALVVIAAVLLAGGLLLTKSRTAWVALALIGGLALLLRFSYLRLSEVWSRRAIGIVIASGASLVIIAALLLQYGSWDREVLAEAPKSLLYRWQYWTGTARLIAEQPILGGGLGQFRTAYLRVKEPAASEEIADPHNFLLDVWYNGGLLALAGALWLAVTLLITCLKTARSEVAESSAPPLFSWELVTGAMAPWLAFGVQFYSEGSWDDRLLVAGLLLVAWAIAVMSGRGMLPQPSRTACGLAALVLCVHLLGAGGIGYAAVLQFLMLLFVAPFSPVQNGISESKPTPFTWLHRSGWFAAVVMVFVLWKPATHRLLEAADQAAAHGRAPQLLRLLYTRANRANWWDPTPHARLAELEFRELQNAPPGEKPAPADFGNKVIRHYEWAIEQDPANGHWWHRLGEIHRTWSKLHPESNSAAEAVRCFQKALDRYPTNARWQADLSDAAEFAGDADLAARSAATALAQDEINQRFGHVERILAGDVRARLSARVSPPE